MKNNSNYLLPVEHVILPGNERWVSCSIPIVPGQLDLPFNYLAIAGAPAAPFELGPVLLSNTDPPGQPSGSPMPAIGTSSARPRFSCPDPELPR